MKKNVVLKSFLVLLVISLMITGFIGCEPERTGTFYIVLTGSCTYDLFMDSTKVFSAVGAGTYTLTKVSVGDHVFEAKDTCEGSPHGTDSVTATVQEGEYEFNVAFLNP